MSWYVESITFHKYPAKFDQFRTSPTQPIGKHLYRCGRKLRGAAKRSVPRKTGRLGSSIKILRYNRGMTDPSIEIGSDVFYAYYVHEGTKPHKIGARPGRTLRFVQNGRVVYAKKVNHPGTRPERYLSKHLKESIS